MAVCSRETLGNSVVLMPRRPISKSMDLEKGPDTIPAVFSNWGLEGSTPKFDQSCAPYRNSAGSIDRSGAYTSPIAAPAANTAREEETIPLAQSRAQPSPPGVPASKSRETRPVFRFAHVNAGRASCPGEHS